MPAGPLICRLVQSARRTSGDGCGGWPTPVDQLEAQEPEGKTGRKLSTMANWPTPRAEKHTPQQRDDFTPASNGGLLADSRCR